MSRECNGEPGTCGFCGYGGGYLGEMGDEKSERLHAAVRTGESGQWEYKHHPNAYGEHCMEITWCGECFGGLAHKFQRYDDTNLRALEISYKVRLELDGIRWSHWETDLGEENERVKKIHAPDDAAVHMEKLRVERDLGQIQQEFFRRFGHGPQEGWRP